MNQELKNVNKFVDEKFPINNIKEMIFSELFTNGFLSGWPSNNWSGSAFKEARIQKESFTSIFSKSNGKKWTCDECLTENDQLKVICSYCDQVRSVEKIEEKPKESLESIFSKSNGKKWTCDECLTENDELKVKCVLCEVDRPDGKKEKQAKESEAQKESLACIFAKSISNKWTCTDCLVQNDQSKAKCVCCDQVRSGAKVAEKPEEILESKTQVSASKSDFSLDIATTGTNSTNSPLIQTPKLPNAIIKHEDKIKDTSIADLSFELKKLDIRSDQFEDNETTDFPSLATLSTDSSGLFDSASKSPNRQSLFGLQNLCNIKSTSSLGLTNGLFGKPTITANFPFGPTSKTCDTFGSSNQTFDFGRITNPEFESIYRLWSIFWLPLDELGLGDNSNLDIANSIVNQLNFTSVPTFNTTNPLSSEISSNLTFFPGSEICNKESDFLESDFKSWSIFSGNKGPNISSDEILYNNAERTTFNFGSSTQTKNPVNGQSNYQGFSFGQAIDINLNFSKSNSNEKIQFSGSNEQLNETSQRRFIKTKRCIR